MIWIEKIEIWAKILQELDSIKKQLELTDYNQIKERLDQCLRWLNEYPKKMQTCVTEKTQKLEEAKRLEEQIQNDKVHAEELEKRVSWLTGCFESERDLGYIPFAKQEEKLNSAQNCITFIWIGSTKSRYIDKKFKSGSF